MNDRDRPTDPAPSDPYARLGQEISELKLALMRVGELAGKLNHTLSMVALAEGTLEHRVNVVTDSGVVHGQQLADHENRLCYLEQIRPTAAE